jgi:branched-chain amino acid transport system substrate-binding protein
MKYFKNLTFFVLVSFTLLSLPWIVSAEEAPEAITFGSALSLSGWMASSVELYQTSNYDLWVEDVNARGGIYVKEYGKRLPVKWKYYDDKSDPATTARMYEKLILSDKVNFVVAPAGTAWHFAAAPIANHYGYQMIGATVSSDALVKRAAAGKLPYYFTAFPPPADIGPAIVDLLAELEVKSVALLYTSTLYGIEYAAALGPQLQVSKIATPIMESYPWDIKDFSPLLKKVKAANVDALLAMGYDIDGALLTEQMMVLGINPKVYYQASMGWGMETYINKFGKNALEGIMGDVAWNKDMPYTGASAYFDRFVKKLGREPDSSSSPFVYATMEIYEQAIEKAGSLDRKKVRDVMAKETFSTVTGPVKFVNQYWKYPVLVGQWQNGKWTGIAPSQAREEKALYPKPEWRKE